MNRHTLAYDKNGNRTSDTSTGANGTETYTYGYDALNRLTATVKNGAVATETRDYDAAHRVKQTTTPTGIRTNTYDANGRLALQNIVEPGSEWSAITYTYDNAGNLTGTLVADLAHESLSSSTNDYQRAEGYQLKTTATTTNSSASQSRGWLTYDYDANGHLIASHNLFELNTANRDHLFVNDAGGNVLQTYYQDSASGQPVHAQRQLVVNGEVLGRYGDVAVSRIPGFLGAPPNWTQVNYEQKADFSFGTQGINSQYPAGTPGSRVVQDGDSLRSIAQAAYGNGGLWYVIAEANGLAGDADLVSGQILKLPAVVDSANNVDTFRPYDPSKIVNDTPTGLPIPKSGGGCGGIGTVIVAVVAVVVTIYTAGLASGASGALVSTMQAGAATLGGTAAGAGTLAASLGTVGTGMAAAAVGSIVSQGVGIAIGAQDSFSWKGVALSAVAGGVGAGMGAVAKGVEGLGFLAGSDLAPTMARAAIGNTLTQGIAVATGLQSSFSWKSVAISAVSAGVTKGLQSAFGYDAKADFNLGKSLATSIGGGAITQLAVNGKINAQQLATDAFGNVVGDALARGSVSGGAGEKQRIDPTNPYGYQGSSGGITDPQVRSIPPVADVSERQTIMGYFADGPGDSALRVNGLTFSESVALRQRELDPGGVRQMVPQAPVGSGPDISAPTDRLFDSATTAPPIASAKTLAVPKSVVEAPASINLSSMQGDFNKLWGSSFPDGRSQEHGGTIVANSAGQLRLVNATSGISKSFTPNLSITAGDSIQGIFHTHPYDSIEGGYTGIGLSGGDAAYLVITKQNVIIAQSGQQQFMYLRTEETAKSVDGNYLNNYQNQQVADFVKGGLGFSAAVDAASQISAKNYGLAYYKGENGVFKKVSP